MWAAVVSGPRGRAGCVRAQGRCLRAAGRLGYGIRRVSTPSSTSSEFAYDQPPSFIERHSDWVWASLVFVATVVLTVLAFPPSKTAEFAYAFAAPGVFWAYTRPTFRLYLWTMLGAQAVAWTIVLGWLHHVTWGGLLLLGPVVGAWVGSWFIAAWWVMPRMLGRQTGLRLLAMVGLAAVWVVIEWTRTWVLSGFPWLTLATSQWQRVSILQVAAYTGAGGVSFVLITMNIAFAAYAHRLIREGRRGLNRRSQEFFAGLFLLLVCLSVHVQETFNRGRYALPVGRFAFVQPYIPQTVKWDPVQADGVLKILEETTLRAAATRPDLMLWPEATTPWAVYGDAQVRDWTERLVTQARAPLLLGSIGIENAETLTERWINGAFVVDPVSGLETRFYAKQHLVPFGEFVPFRPVLGWIGKFVPIGGDFARGDNPAPLVIATKGSPFAVGALICFEDIFPKLARESTMAGADVLVVLTNNGWFGEGGAAYQHAAHSVLRAVETRRPVLRVGNGGWSGWIDEFGTVRAVLQKTPEGKLTVDPLAEGSVYFRGTQTISVTCDSRWVGQMSFYVQHGDWFVGLCVVLAGLGALAIRGPIKAPAVDEPSDLAGA